MPAPISQLLSCNTILFKGLLCKIFCQFSLQSQRKAMSKSVQTTTQLNSSPMVTEYCLAFSKSDFNSTWTKNFQMFKMDLQKAEEPEIKLPTSVGSLKNQENSRENIYFCLIDYTKPFDYVAHNKLENSPRDENTRPTDLPPEKSVCTSKSNI